MTKMAKVPSNSPGFQTEFFTIIASRKSGIDSAIQAFIASLALYKVHHKGILCGVCNSH